MSALPDMLLQPAASFDWETLLPVVFFVLYGLSQFLGSRKKEAVEDEAGEPEVDPLERARQIREEIRRKLEERQQQAPAPGQGHAQSAPPPPRPAAAPQAQPRPAQRPVVLREADPISTNLPVPEFEKRLAQQHERLKEARRLQQEAMAKARRMKEQTRVRHKKTFIKPVASASTALAVDAPGKLRRELLAGLRDPNSLRKAVLYREILDPPLGLR